MTRSPLLHLTFFGIAAGLLIGCGPKPPASRPEAPLVATVGDRPITLQRFHEAKEGGNMAGIATHDEVQFWDDWVDRRVRAMAASRDGIDTSTTHRHRWSSIRQRILTDLHRRLFLTGQAGFPESLVAPLADSLTLVGDTAARETAVRLLLARSVNLDSAWAADSASLSLDSATLANPDARRARLLDHLRENRVARALATFPGEHRNAWKVELLTPRPTWSEDSLRTFWREHPMAWIEPAVYRMMVLRAADSASLAALLAPPPCSPRERRSSMGCPQALPLDSSSFAKLSARFPAGTPAAPGGLLGRVRENHSLPYGIGMVPRVWSVFRRHRVIDLPKVEGPILLPDSSWGLFLALDVEPARPRPWEIVKDQVFETYTAAQGWTPADTAVRVRWDRGVLFTQADLQFILEEVPLQMRIRFPPDRVLQMMIDWAVGARAAEDAGLMSRSLVAAILEDQSDVFWSQLWNEGPMARSWGIDSARRDSAWLARPPTLLPVGAAVDSSDGINRDAVRLVLAGPDFLTRQFAILADRIWNPADSSYLPATSDSANQIIWEASRVELDRRGQERLDSVLRELAGYRAGPLEPAPRAFTSTAAMLDSARSFHDRQSLDSADALYRRIIQSLPVGDSLRDRARFLLGQVQTERGRHAHALQEFRRLIQESPRGPETYKAWFMIGFILSEHIRDQARAVHEFRRMLTAFPETDLSDDADWMIRNIESNGGLMPDFSTLGEEGALTTPTPTPAGAP